MGQATSTATNEQVRELIKSTTTETYHKLISGINTPEHMLHCVANFTRDMMDYVNEYAPKYDIKITNEIKDTLLHKACNNSSPEPILIPALIKLGVDINAKNKYGKTALHYSVVNKHHNSIEITRLLLTNNIGINIQDNDDRTALHFALLDKNIPMEKIRLLVTFGSNINITDKNKRTCGYIAASRYPEVLPLLIQHGLNLNAPDSYGDTLINSLLRNENSYDFDIIKLLINNKINVNNVDLEGLTPLMNIIALPKPNVIKLIDILVDAGANVNARDKNGLTPLIISFNLQSIYKKDIIKQLIFHKVDLNLQTNEGWTALHFAVDSSFDYDDINLVKLLLENGADPNIKTKNNVTVFEKLFTNSSTPHLEVIFQLLLDYHANPNDAFSDGSTCLHKVCRLAKGRNLVKLLLKSGVNFTIMDKSNWLPLYIACCFSRIDIVKIILDAYDTLIYKHLKKNHVTAALHVICMQSMSPSIDIIKLLFDTGIDTETLVNGKTILQLLTQDDKTITDLNIRIEILKLLIEAKANIYIKHITQEITILHYIVKNWFTKLDSVKVQEIIVLLKNYGYDLSFSDSLGNTILHLMVDSEISIYCLTTLVGSRIIDINAKKNNGDTALLLAKNKNTILTLLSLGADPSIANIFGENILIKLVKNNISQINNEDRNFLFTHIVDKYPKLLHSTKTYKGHNLLFEAISSNNETITNILLSTNIDVNYLNKCGNNALHCIFEDISEESIPNINIIKSLIKSGVSVTHTNEDGFTPLHYYVNNCSHFNKEDILNLDIIYMLSDLPSNMNIFNRNGNTIFFSLSELLVLNWNSESNKSIIIETFNHLIDKGGNINLLNKKGFTCMAKLLISGIYYNFPKQFADEYIWNVSANHNKIDVSDFNFRDLYEYYYMGTHSEIHNQFDTERFFCVENLKCIKGTMDFLIKASFKNIDKNQQTLINTTDHNGNTILHTTIILFNIYVSRILHLQYQCAQIKNIKKYPESVIQDIINLVTKSINDSNAKLYPEFISIAQLFINYGSNVNAKNKDGKTPLHIICELPINDHTEKIIKLLINSGANVNSIDIRGNTVLHELAQHNNNSELISYISSLDAIVNNKNNDGDIALHIAIQKENSDMMMHLLNHGAKLYIRNNNNISSLNMLFNKCHEKINNDVIAKSRFTNCIKEFINNDVDISEEKTINEIALFAIGEVIEIIKKYKFVKNDCNICFNRINVFECKYHHYMCLKCLININTFNCEMCRTTLLH